LNKEIKMIDIKEIQKMNDNDLFNYIKNNNLLDHYIDNLDRYSEEDIENYMSDDKKINYKNLSCFVVRQLDKDKFNKWIEIIKEWSKGKDTIYEYEFIFYLAFAISDREKLEASLLAINK